MSLFDRIVMWRYRAGALSRRELVVLLRQIRAYQHAYRNNLELPELPRHMQRSLRVLWIWSAHRLFCEQPVAFVWGVLLALPAFGVVFYVYAGRIFNFVMARI